MRCAGPVPPSSPSRTKKNGPWKRWVYYPLLSDCSEEIRRGKKKMLPPHQFPSLEEKRKKKQPTKVSWAFSDFVGFALFVCFLKNQNNSFQFATYIFVCFFPQGQRKGLIKSLRAVVLKYMLCGSLWKQLCWVQTLDDETENTSKITGSSPNHGAALFQLSRIKLSQENKNCW